MGIKIFAVLLTVVSFGYFLPTSIALWRRHHNTGAIFVLDFLTGWTLIGWIVSFVWAVVAVAPIQVAVVKA